MALIKPCQAAMQGASKAISRGDWELHQKTVSEGVQCLQWLITAPGPKDVVESYIGGTDFHANKIRVKYKKTEPKQIAFCDTFKRYGLGVPRCRGAFTPSTRLVSRRGARGWSLFRV